MSHPHRVHHHDGRTDPGPPGWRATRPWPERSSESDTLPHYPPRQLESAWYDEDLDADLERDRRRSRLGAFLVGALAVATVAVGLGLWAAADDAELAATPSWSPAAAPLVVDDFLALPHIGPPLAPDDAQVPAETAPPAVAPRQTSVDPERERSIEKTNAFTDALNRYELSKFRGDPDPLSTIDDPELRESIQAVRGED